jgi:two-component system sensor histidine kinase/response regulator
MDLHMPNMSGYEAAEKIRELSSEVPIIAMTADVIRGVREKCEQSGIYHYISKPFNPDHFLQTIKDIILENEPKTGKDTTVLDRKLGLENMGGNEELYNQVLIEYYHENQNTLDKLEAAVRERQYADAAQIVHKLKGSSGSIGAKSLHDIAVSFQKVLIEEKENEIEPLQERFSKLLKLLLEELNVIAKETRRTVGKRRVNNAD